MRKRTCVTAERTGFCRTVSYTHLDHLFRRTGICYIRPGTGPVQRAGVCDDLRDGGGDVSL